MSWLKLISVIESLKHFAKQKWRHQAAGNKKRKQLGFLTFEPGHLRPDCRKRILFWSKTSKSRACSEVKLQKFGACSGFLEVKNRPWSVAHTRIPNIRKFPPRGQTPTQTPLAFYYQIDFRAQTMKIGPRITFFLNISNLSKNYLINYFIMSQILV